MGPGDREWPGTVFVEGCHEVHEAGLHPSARDLGRGSSRLSEMDYKRGVNVCRYTAKE